MTTSLPPIAAFLKVATAPEEEPGGARMRLGPHTRNSYGAPSGGAVASLIAESAQAIFPHRLAQRIHVRFLASVREGSLHARPRVLGTDCEVLATDDRGRLAAFGTLSFRAVKGVPAGPMRVTRTRAASQWRHVPLLGWLGIQESETEKDGVCFEMPMSSVFRNEDGIPHAGAIVTLVDLAAGQLAQRSDPSGPVVTLDAEVRMLRLPVGESLRAHATPLHAGRRIVSSAVVVEDGAGHVAHASVALLRVGT